jgi:tape measure domain-containing protein
MADENISIEIKDGVASSISTKIDRIAQSSRSAFSAVEQLKRMLASLDGNAINILNAAASRSVSVLQNAAVASQRLAQAQMNTATAAARAAAAQQQVATAAVNTATATQRLATAQAQTNTAQTQGATAAQNLATATTRTATAQTQGATAAQRLQAATSQTAASQSRAQLAALRLQQAQNAANESTTRLTGSVGGLVTKLAAAALAYVSLKSIGELADSYTTLQNKLQTVATTQGQVNLLTEQMFVLANKTRTEVEATATAFVRFDRALAIMGKSQSETLRLTETVNKALVVGGATAGEAASALLQLSQAFNSGKLQGDEFRSLAENMPVVLDAVAKVMKKPIDQIKELGSQGKITAQVLFDAFKSIEKQIDSTFAKTTPTMSQAFTVLKNNFTEFIGRLDKATGLSTSFAKAIISIANAIKTFSNDMDSADSNIVQLIKSIGGLAGMLVDTLGQAFNAVASVAVSVFEMFGAKLDEGSTASKFFEVALKAVVTVMQTIIVIVSDVIYVFKMVALEVVGLAKQLWALANLDFSGFSAISDAMKIDAERARKELDAFQDRVMKFGQPAFKDDETQRLINRSKTAAMQPEAKLRQAGTPQPTTPPKDKAAESRAQALLKVNTQLDNEIQRMGMLKPLRESQQKLDQIEETLLGKKIKLHDSERIAIMAKIQTIQQQARVQSEVDRIYEETNGPILAYNATLDATAKLLKQGAISQKEYNGQQAAALEILETARDPMREANRDLQQQFDLLKLMPQQREVEQQVQQLIIDQLSKKNPLTEKEVQLYRDKLTTLQQLNMVSQAEGAIMADTVLKRQGFITQLQAIKNLQANPASGFTAGDSAETATNMLKSMGLDTSSLQVAADANVSIIKTMYDQVNQLVQANLISEQDASNARAQIWMKDQENRMQSSQKFFTGLAGLQNSSNKKLAAIGKAAAITNAVIDTYKSATGAYAAMSSIPYVGPALGAAAAAAAIAAGMANVAQIRSQQSTGFQTGGYTGDMARNAVAGSVHGQEFVFDAPAVDRIGVQQLESIRRGEAPPAAATAPTAAPATNVNTRIINVIDPAIVEEYMATPEGEQVVLNLIRRNSDSLRSTFANA